MRMVHVLRIAQSILVSTFLFCGGADAAELSGLLGTGYGSVSGRGADTYTAYGALLASSSNGRTNGQLNIGYARATLGGVSLDDTYAEGSGFFRGSWGALGLSGRVDRIDATATFGRLTLAGTDTLISYGAFGEAYLGESVTLFGKGGGFSNALEGLHGGAGLKWYVLDSIAVGAAYQYAESSGTALDVKGVGVQFLLSRSMPVVLGVTAQETTNTAGPSTTAFMATLSFRLGSGRPSLSTWDRQGPAIITGGFNL